MYFERAEDTDSFRTWPGIAMLDIQCVPYPAGPSVFGRLEVAFKVKDAREGAIPGANGAYLSMSRQCLVCDDLLNY